MLIEDVKKLSPKETFLYWIQERNDIYLKRTLGQKKPWTDDEILQSYFFTNPFRENDKVTKWFRENIRGPLHHNIGVLMATVIFRWFNKPEPTGRLLIGSGLGEPDCLLTNWNSDRAIEILEGERDKNGGPIFTGAFMIKAGNGPPGCKIRNVCKAVDPIWKDRQDLFYSTLKAGKLEHLWKRLQDYPHLGGFLSYEIVCDLRYTKLLNKASDVDSFCNPGPGAKRGLNRIRGLVPPELKLRITKAEWKEETQALLSLVREELVRPGHIPHVEMREIEHSLCEYDKYARALSGSGKMKRKYKGAE